MVLERKISKLLIGFKVEGEERKGIKCVWGMRSRFVGGNRGDDGIRC